MKRLKSIRGRRVIDQRDLKYLSPAFVSTFESEAEQRNASERFNGHFSTSKCYFTAEKGHLINQTEKNIELMLSGVPRPDGEIIFQHVAICDNEN